RRQRAVRVVRDRRAERVEQMRGVEIGESRRRQHVAHPPEVPEKAVVVAGVAWDRVAQMPHQRPGPGNGERGEEGQRRDVRQGARGTPAMMRRLGNRVLAGERWAEQARPLLTWTDDELAVHLPAAVLDLEIAVVTEGSGAIGAELEGDRVARADALGDPV